MGHGFVSNKIHTSEYSLLTFIPKNLYRQFRRLSNVFFLLIAILQQIPGISPTGRFTTALPLGLVLLVTAVKEAFEDVRRHRSDQETNRRQVSVLSLETGSFSAVAWQDLAVGSIVRIIEREQIPADLLLLSSSSGNGGAYIETSNLDGETNLKARQAIPATAVLDSAERLQAWRDATIKYEGPNVHIYTFNGSLQPPGAAQAIPLSAQQVLLRGAVLRNTKWVFGLVLYTGHDTKILRNSVRSPSKRTWIERQTNKQVFGMLIFEILLCILSTVGFVMWTSRVGQDQTHLALTGLASSGDAFEAFKAFLTFFILYNNLIPISLFVSMEIVKFVQAGLIASDVCMYDPVTDTPAVARTSNLNEELGQVEFLFSDKTGTLTENDMKFRKLCVAGKSYSVPARELDATDDECDEAADGDFDNSHSRQATALSNNSITVNTGNNNNNNSSDLWADVESVAASTQSSTIARDHSFATLLGDLQSESPQGLFNEHALLVMSLCHSVVPEFDEDGELTLQGASPDEVALLLAARRMGYNFVRRSPDSITLVIHGVEQPFAILNVLEFSSTRKRMSVICQMPDDSLRLLTKGADSVIIERLAAGQSMVNDVVSHVARYAEIGLRTLLLAERTIPVKEYKHWLRDYWQPASTALHGRDELLAKAAEVMEVSLRLLGATAIEDRLQAGVPETIAALSQAGIKLWMLTGDKQETAINIGFSCQLLQPAHYLLVLNEQTQADTAARLDELLEATSGQAWSPTDGGPAQQQQQQQQRRQCALIIDGMTLAHALSPSLAALLLKLAVRCDSVIACRVSPLQKAQIVTLVRNATLGSRRRVTMAIGDGANDVSMIHAAHVGIGISGREGLQAARSADYSIAQFRFLQQLLLVHGAWDHRRIAMLILYSFYKNITLYLVQFWFALYNGFSGQTLFERWTISLYNVLFTSLPIIVHGIYDQEVSARMLVRFPGLYRETQQHVFFSTRVFWKWTINAIYHSFLLFFGVILATGAGCFSLSGRTNALWEQGLMVYTSVVLTVNGMLALETHSWTLVHVLAQLVSVGGWFAFVWAYARTPISPELMRIDGDLYPNLMYWLIVFGMAALCLVRDVIERYVEQTFYPRPSQVVSELGR